MRSYILIFKLTRIVKTLFVPTLVPKGQKWGHVFHLFLSSANKITFSFEHIYSDRNMRWIYTKICIKGSKWFFVLGWTPWLSLTIISQIFNVAHDRPFFIWNLCVLQYAYLPDRRSMPAGIPIQTITAQSLQGKTVSLHLPRFISLCCSAEILHAWFLYNYTV